MNISAKKCRYDADSNRFLCAFWIINPSVLIRSEALVGSPDLCFTGEVNITIV